MSLLRPFARSLALSPALHLRPFPTSAHVRFAATAPMRGTPVHMNILDPWLPAPISNPFSAEGRSALWQRTKRMLTYGMTLYQLRKRKLTLKQFKQDAEVLYCGLNDALARGDKEQLEKVATVSMCGILNPEIKRIRKIGYGVWQHHGPVSTTVLNLVTAQVQNDPAAIGFGEEREFYIVQITTKVVSKQSYALFAKDGTLLGGDASKEVDMVEHVVFERKLSASDAGWKIAGKIASTVASKDAKDAK
ncbi:39S ribosomal protein L45, mitochondrial [Chytriomyces hyalinus]|uniref:Large ribosomal subunit protein mL45 n=1 Tax=Chytriomyces confervae TaxID=246404 RepID=A0A507FH93_9FUNG|nr:39S ribosomal protein L45, mitochondrial [Chytriomyces hyalinus]KAJ3259495.1 39S ribosomal protein L45, mitochondrial [Chytriomyces hyalinus]KAJ3404965.1 39S ribosomal protein L45, mitochondrial [Chytriomyces hyalinus]TPX75653.1 hypothetical protein CcCBS67573_g03067 [Chytriomyces confervae]